MGNASLHKEALEAIERARESKKTSLSLRKLGLTDIPNTVFESKWIQSLDLSSNKLITLPQNLFRKFNVAFHLIIFYRTAKKKKKGRVFFVGDFNAENSDR